jgi:hypothetical protein
MVLADLLESAFNGEVESQLRPTGRPKKIAARQCASAARKFYNYWKAIDERLGICDRGHSDEMKDEACHSVIEMHRLSRRRMLVSDHPLNVVVKFEEVRELMDRPAGRRM